MPQPAPTTNGAVTTILQIMRLQSTMAASPFHHVK
jgi:hypothetical protein